ncbi:thioredoxin family protein [Niveibacterium terrae]|uniref:thioredoxin family protein n=1 Tax=Niveibacterium terrae TaxID=3373598 RepID=UPI003A93703D
MKITLYSSSCSDCLRTSTLALVRALEARGVEFEIETVTDYAMIAAAGVLALPGIAVEGRLVSTGKLPTPDDVDRWLR